MEFTKLSRPDENMSEMFIGALLRIPAQAIHRRIIRELNEAGFTELRLPHMAVMQYPGPDGVRPGVLAERASISKQAMNQLLGSLEEMGYLSRGVEGSEGRARIVRLTDRGRAVAVQIRKTAQEIEREWSAELGEEEFGELKRALRRVVGGGVGSAGYNTGG